MTARTSGTHGPDDRDPGEAGDPGGAAGARAPARWIDEALLAEAGRVLGTAGAADTVNAALAAAVAERRRQEAVEAEVAALGPAPDPPPGPPAASPGPGPGWLVDPSAGAQAHRPEVAALLAGLLRAGLAWSHPLLDLAALGGAGSAAEHRERSARRRAAYRRAELTPAVLERCAALQARLAAAGPAPEVPVSALVTAAVAQLHGLTVLHADPALARLGRVCGLAERSVLDAAPGRAPDPFPVAAPAAPRPVSR